ncbi:MAG TPA: hypothetical protein VLG47_01665 [Candidatus Saccharimonadales bacterium]|nr:hypothetical protein [Candidatus Saccharimonadales bacterium]
MRKYKLFTKPAKVADVIQEDLNTDISSKWQGKFERISRRGWNKVHSSKRLIHDKTAIKHKTWRHGNFGHMLET